MQREIRRVAVTGLGLVTPLGPTVESTWRRLLAGDCAISRVPELEALPCQIAGRVRRGTGPGEFDAKPFLSNARTQDVEFISFALAAAQEALDDAGWHPTEEEDMNMTGVAVGSGIGSLEEIQAAAALLAQPRGHRRISPFFVTRLLINMAAGHISMTHNLRGPNHSCVTACATGAHSIGDASRLIAFGDADVMVAGGTEAAITPLAIAGFSRAKALCTSHNDDPEGSSRPFDSARSGFVMGEGAGVVVLEELEHAKRRGAHIYAEVSGYGLSGDAHHITAPHPSGRGAVRAMSSALRQSGRNVEDIDHINCHATSTPLGDAIEATAMQTVLGDHVGNVPVTATKGATGHLLGAAGAVEAIFAVLAVDRGIIPPTINLSDPDPACSFLNIVANEAREAPVSAALTNSFGFGGTNCSLMFTKVSH